MAYTDAAKPAIHPGSSKFMRIRKTVQKDAKKNWTLYLLVSPVILFYILFHYWPMYGVLIAFMDFRPAIGMAESPWVGLDHFTRFFNGPFFFRLIRNTFIINVQLLIFGFPAPILLALMMNELRSQKYKRTVQTITYMPFFLSAIVVVGMIQDFTLSTGIINDIIYFFGGTRRNLLADASLFRSIFVTQDIWRTVGFGSIVYLAALANIDQEQYEAAMIDGAGRFRKLISITLPGIMPTIVILLILRMGAMMTIGFETIMLMASPPVYAVGDVIGYYVFRVGIQQGNFSFAAAVGLFNSVINFALLITANAISRRVNETSLW